MPDTLLRNFRFQITLRKSATAEAGAPASAATAARSTQAPAAQTTEDLSKAPPGTPLGDGGFQDCSGLDIEMEVAEYQEGGRNDGVIRRAGRAKYVNIILKRGMFYGGNGGVNRDLWNWLQGVISGQRPIARFDGLLQVMGSTNDVVATWVFDRGLPAKIRGPELNGKTGDIAIEELHIAHEGLRLVSS